MIGFKTRYANEKQVCNSFKNFSGQNPTLVSFNRGFGVLQIAHQSQI